MQQLFREYEMNFSKDDLSINTLRFLAVDGVEAANSGHPGLPMGAAPLAYAIWTKFLKFDPTSSKWPDRDRFVLSAGHGSMLLYGLLHMAGFDVSLDDLKNFRQWGAITPGHPESFMTPGVETTTGPLGQGISAAVGMAIAERHLAARFNRPGFDVINHHTYVLAGDGDLMEGVSAEAASLAGCLGLGRLIAIYDSNDITIEGGTDLAFTEDVGKRFEAHGWQVLHAQDGNDVENLVSLLAQARDDESRPTLIIAKTKIGFGSPKFEGTADVHGSPLGADERKKTKENMKWPLEPEFLVPEGSKAPFEAAAEAGKKAKQQWDGLLKEYAAAHPELAAELKRRLDGSLPDGWEAALPSFPADAKGMATRVSSGKVLNSIADALPELVGGSADLAPSTKTYIDSDADFEKNHYEGRNIRFGVREHGMGAVVNGMANHGGVRPYGSTFFVFSDYMRPSIRLAALMKLPVVYVFTHDSFYLGEDGPTHQPIEQLPSLRAMPNLTLIRPADANEVSEAWRIAVERKNGPTALVLSRQNVPTLDRTALAPASGIARGGYILKEASGGTDSVRLIIIASGSEVHLALEAADALETEGVRTRVVNMASTEIFDAQPAEYRETVLPSMLKKRVAVEAAAPHGWERYVGMGGRILGIERFGASAPAKTLAEKFGFTPDNLLKLAHDVLAAK